MAKGEQSGARSGLLNHRGARRPVLGRNLVYCIGLLYVVQMVGVAYCRAVPVFDVTVGMTRYECRAGVTWIDLVPVLGMRSVILQEPCCLVMTDLRSGKVTRTMYDVPSDALYDYPDLYDCEDLRYLR